MIRNSLFKILSILLIGGLNWAGFLAVGETFAYFNDMETSTDNTFQAGTLDFSLISLQDNFGPRPEVALNMMPGDTVSREIKIKNEGSLLFQYNARTEKISGDDDFCQGLQLSAQLEGVPKYTGGLIDFNFQAIEISDLEDNWLFIISLPYGSSFVNKFCQFKFVFEAWQMNSSSGFSDREEISSQLASWGLRINEVYYDVDESHGTEVDNEWIEIYNQTDQAIDISGWKICDNYDCDTIPPSTPIPAKGFAVITASSTTWNYWTIPSGAVKIVLGNEFGNGLHNDGDRVILQRTDGQEIDALSYGTDNYAFSPPAPDVAEGHSLARRIAGYETNQATDWEDLITPNPGINPHLIADEEELANEEEIDKQEVDQENEEEISQENSVEEIEELANEEITGDQIEKEDDNQEVNIEETDEETIEENKEELNDDGENDSDKGKLEEQTIEEMPLDAKEPAVSPDDDSGSEVTIGDNFDSEGDGGVAHVNAGDSGIVGDERK